MMVMLYFYDVGRKFLDVGGIFYNVVVYVYDGGGIFYNGGLFYDGCIVS